MNTTIRKIGNSEGIIIPMDVLERLNLRAGETVVLLEEGNELRLRQSTDDPARVRAQDQDRARTAGIRHEDMLESASSGPLQEQAYGGPDLSGLAAAYLFGIAKNHPFVDGNKRTALASGDLFLYFNGFSLEAGQEEIIQLLTMVAAGIRRRRRRGLLSRSHRTCRRLNRATTLAPRSPIPCR